MLLIPKPKGVGWGRLLFDHPRKWGAPSLLLGSWMTSNQGRRPRKFCGKKLAFYVGSTAKEAEISSSTTRLHLGVRNGRGRRAGQHTLLGGAAVTRHGARAAATDTAERTNARLRQPGVPGDSARGGRWLGGVALRRPGGPGPALAAETGGRWDGEVEVIRCGGHPAVAMARPAGRCRSHRGSATNDQLSRRLGKIQIRPSVHPVGHLCI